MKDLRTFKYRAFISYSHQDKKWSDWLHKSIETYRVPKGLIGKKNHQGAIPARLFPVFRDREELASSNMLGSALELALKESAYLIVICSPNSAKSQWVDQEIRSFKALGKSDRILCFIVKGEPYASEQPAAYLDECLPEAVRYQIDCNGELTDQRCEPIAADARDGKDGKINSLLKILAGMLGVGFDDLKQREVLRKQRKMLAVSVASLMLMLIMMVLTFWALNQREKAMISKKNEEVQKIEANKQRDYALEQKDRAEFENYFNLVALASARVNEGSFVQAQKLLWSTYAKHRNWEWGYLMNYCHQDLLTIDAEGFVLSLDFSPDGKLMAIAGERSAVTIVDNDSGQIIERWNIHKDIVHSVRFSRNGAKLVTASRDKTAKICEVSSGKELICLEHVAAVYCATFSPDGKSVVTGDGNGDAHVWDAENGNLIMKLKGHGKIVYSVDFSGDGHSIVTGSWDETARIWSARTGRERFILTGHEGYVYSVSFSLKGDKVVTAGRDGTARVWKVNTGEQIRFLKGHSKPVHSAIFSPSGKHVLTTSFDHTAKLWQLVDGAKVMTFRGHAMDVLSSAFAKDGRSLATGSRDGTVKIWNPASRLENRTLKDSEEYVTSRDYSPDGGMVLIADGSKLATIRRAKDNKKLIELKGHSDSVFAVAFSNSGKSVLTGSFDNTAKLWGASSGREMMTLTGHSKQITSVAFSPDDKRILTGSLDKTIKLWDSASGREVMTLKEYDSQILFVTFADDGLSVLGGNTGIPGIEPGVANIWRAFNAGLTAQQVAGQKLSEYKMFRAEQEAE